MKLRTRDIIEQIRHGNIPDGYKKTKAGILPVDWDVHMLRDCLQRIERPVEVEPNELYTQIGIRSHGKGLFYKEPVTGEALGNKSVFWIEPDCFIVNIVFAWEQAIGKTTQSEVGMIGSHRFPMYRPVNDRVDINYLIYYFLTKRGTNILEAASPGGAGRNKTLGQNRFLKSKIILPSIEEQRKIAAILMTQDKVIELKEKRLTEKQRQKKYLLQQLLTRQKRLPGFTSEVEETNIKAISIYSVSSISQTTLEKYEGKRLYPVFNANSIAGYVDFFENEYPYISIIKDGAGIGRVRLCEAKSSTIGTMGCIHARKGISIVFLYYLLEQVDFRKYSNGSTIPHLYYKDYSCEKVWVPDIQEQTAIAEVLSTADREIDLHRQNIEQEKQKKKALMQLLLTGIVRVKT